MNLIKILDPVKAEQLALAGFNYIKEFLGNKEIYSFVQTDDLMKQVNSTFSKNEYFIDNTMNFNSLRKEVIYNAK